jgi:hypothetical protein
MTLTNSCQIRRAPNAACLQRLLPDDYAVIRQESTRSWALTWRGQVLVSGADFSDVKRAAENALFNRFD